MKGTFDDLSPEDKVLATTRRRGDYVINCAIEWIGRFHAQVPSGLIVELVKGVQVLARTMQGRSPDTMEIHIARLLEIQANMLLPGAQVAKPRPVFDRNLPTSEIPRLHKEWQFKDNQFAREAGPTSEIRVGLPVFISYARADSAFLSRVLVHLRPLERSGRIELWHDGKLVPGRPWQADLNEALMRASAAVLIVSANFMASDFVCANELPRLAIRARAEGVAVFPVIFGHCLLDEDPYLADLQLFNDPEHPLSHILPSEADAVLLKLAKAIRERT